jgi:hypothetical protein
MLEVQQIGVVLPLLLAAGCAIHHPDGSYRLSARDSTTVLIPPGVSSPALEQRTLDVGAVRGTGPCPPDQVPILIRNARKRFRLTIHRRALLDRPAGWLADWAAGLEEQGCLRPGSAFMVAEFIAESMPLDPSQSFRLLSSPAGGDILPLSRIQVVTPILPPGFSGAPLPRICSAWKPRGMWSSRGGTKAALRFSRRSLNEVPMGKPFGWRNPPPISFTLCPKPHSSGLSINRIGRASQRGLPPAAPDPT